MPEDQDQAQINDEPSRRKFLKVSVVAGATVAALAAGAGMIPKLASGAATATAASASSPKAESVSFSSREPLIVVLKGDSMDVYQGESKFPVQDSTLAREIASKVNVRIR
jgi:flagellar basal body-associated protein FliL